VKQGDGSMNQGLVELFFLADRLSPQIFQHIVTMEEFFGVERAETVEIRAGVQWRHERETFLRFTKLLTGCYNRRRDSEVTELSAISRQLSAVSFRKCGIAGFFWLKADRLQFDVLVIEKQS
jgi:hypothetical protein